MLVLLARTSHAKDDGEAHKDAAGGKEEARGGAIQREVEETEDNGQDKEDERSQDEEASEGISHRQSLAEAPGMLTDDWLKPLVDPSWDICIPQARGHAAGRQRLGSGSDLVGRAHIKRV